MHASFVLWILSCVTIIECNKRCFECTDEPLPSDCQKVIECPDDHRCQQLKGRRSDLTVCEECCTGEFCNNAGCGATVPARANRGPYCFICDHQLSPVSCRNIDRCEMDETCSIKYDVSTKHYVTECMPKFQCSAALGMPVGKRFSLSTDSCFSCCHDDFCNDNCTQAKPVTTTGSWTQWSTWTACSVTCGQGQRSRSRSCQGGTGCAGINFDGQVCSALGSCTQTTASGNNIWTTWTAWTPCSHTCDIGTRQRTRACVIGPCDGETVELVKCDHLAPCNSINTHYLTEEYCKQKGYDKVNAHAGCIKLLFDNVNWEDGQRLCTQNGGNMFTAETATKQMIMDTYLGRVHATGYPYVWLGLKNNGHRWFWEGSSQHLVTSDMYNNFGHPLAYNHHGHMACGLVNNPNGTTYYWFMKNCFGQHHVLCEYNE